MAAESWKDSWQRSYNSNSCLTAQAWTTIDQRCVQGTSPPCHQVFQAWYRSWQHHIPACALAVQHACGQARMLAKASKKGRGKGPERRGGWGGLLGENLAVLHTCICLGLPGACARACRGQLKGQGQRARGWARGVGVEFGSITYLHIPWLSSMHVVQPSCIQQVHDLPLLMWLHARKIHHIAHDSTQG